MELRLGDGVNLDQITNGWGVGRKVNEDVELSVRA